MIFLTLLVLLSLLLQCPYNYYLTSYSLAAVSIFHLNINVLYLSVYLSVCPSVCLSISLSVCESVCVLTSWSLSFICLLSLSKSLPCGFLFRSISLSATVQSLSLNVRLTFDSLCIRWSVFQCIHANERCFSLYWQQKLVESPSRQVAHAVLLTC